MEGDRVLEKEQGVCGREAGSEKEDVTSHNKAIVLKNLNHKFGSYRVCAVENETEREALVCVELSSDIVDSSLDLGLGHLDESKRVCLFW